MEVRTLDDYLVTVSLLTKDNYIPQHHRNFLLILRIFYSCFLAWSMVQGVVLTCFLTNLIALSSAFGECWLADPSSRCLKHLDGWLHVTIPIGKKIMLMCDKVKSQYFLKVMYCAFWFKYLTCWHFGLNRSLGLSLTAASISHWSFKWVRHPCWCQLTITDVEGKMEL